MISVFTPTHDPTWLLDAYNSLRDQGYEDWEWVVLANGKDVASVVARIPTRIKDDPRVRVEVAPAWGAGRIGLLKRLACDRCGGAILLELDHDDVLVDSCLQRVADAVGHGAGFVYSDYVTFTPAGDSLVHDEAWGWESYDWEYQGRPYIAQRAFPPCPRSLSNILWAPNHVRAWTRQAYDSAGGHDPDMPVADDFDLVVRTWLCGQKFTHIPEPLYLYRDRDPGDRELAPHEEASLNTYLLRAEEIEERMLAIADRNTWKIAEEWCRREGLQVLDLAALIAPWETIPIETSTVGLVRATDCLHWTPAGLAPALLNEVYRVLVPGGWLASRTPSTTGRLAFADPRARSFWNDLSFRYFTESTHAATVPGLRARFQAARVWEDFPTEGDRDDGLTYVYADLVALKGQRTPGLQLI